MRKYLLKVNNKDTIKTFTYALARCCRGLLLLILKGCHMELKESFPWKSKCRISLAEIDVTFKVTFISANEIASCRFSRKIFLKKQLRLRQIDRILRCLGL